ncbi:MAG: OmpW family protein, partial [Burkholderiales bacterium]|nr:OmpW family protein [Burkholderiales bacterium]
MKIRILMSVTTAFAISIGTAHAQQAGDNIVNFGWLHIAPQDSSSPMTTNVNQQFLTPLVVPASFTSPG